MADGSRPFLDPVFSANGKLKTLQAVVNGMPKHHSEGVYFLRYRKEKNVWESVGSDPQLALLRKSKREKFLEAKCLGIAVVDGTEESSGTHRLLTDAIAEYLAETK